MDMNGFFSRNEAVLNKLYPGQDYAARYSEIADNFRKNFGAEPELFVSAPGRVEVVGNHTDHNRGHVLAASVDLDFVGAFAANGSDRIRMYSRGYDRLFEIDLTDLSVHDDEKETTLALMRGVAARLKELGYKIGGFDAQVASTVFKGSGLSSSAGLEVMFTGAFDALFNGGVIDPKENALISQYAEVHYFGKPCGVMDQTASAVGGLVKFDFSPDIPAVEAISYDFAAKGYAVCVVSAGGEHGNLTYAYASIPTEMKQVAAVLGAPLMEKFTAEDLMRAMPKLKNVVSDRAILRAFHFVDETQRAVDAAEALKRDDIKAFFDAVVASGESSWKLLQNLHVEGSDNQELPLAFELSRRVLEGRGAWRINGGGFAGTIVAFVPSDLLKTYSETMNAVFGEKATTVLNIRPVGVVCLK